MISAELTFDHQHGPVVTVHCAGKRISIYLMDETGVITDDADGTGYGIEVKGDWWKLRQMLEQPNIPLVDEVVDVKVVLELRKEIERLKAELAATRRCAACKGTGIEDDYFRCKACGGKGY